MLKKIGFTVLSVFAAVSIVGAASAQDAQTPPADQPVEQGVLRQNGGEPIWRELLQIVADDLNLEPRDVLQQVRGQTLADVIAAQNGNIAQITADVVAALTERINQAVTNGRLTQERADEIIANLGANVESALNGALRGALIDRFGAGRLGLGGQRGQGGQFRQNLLNRDVRPLLDAVQDALGLTGQQLAETMRGGSTLGDVITAHNGDAAAIVDAAIATAAERLDAVRENGTLTQEQEDAILGGLRAFYEAVLNGAFQPQAAAQGSL